MVAVKTQALYNEILEAIESNKLPIPSQPEIATELQEVVNDPGVTVEDLCKIIKKDPGLTARILRLANSPLVRGRVPIQGLDNAIARMGVGFVGNLAIGLALEQMFKTSNKLIAQRMNAAWEHCSYVACICSALAVQNTKLPVDQAMLAGVLHEIGILSILSFAEKHPEILTDEQTLDKIIETHSAKLSQAIMTAWQFAPELRSIPVELYDYYLKKDKADLADTLLVAKIYALDDTTHPLAKLNRAELPAFKRLGLDPKKSLDHYSELKEAVDLARELLG
ncbi:MAG: HDOD domain-containing protein [Candidatus Berkiella sp.]